MKTSRDSSMFVDVAAAEPPMSAARLAAERAFAPVREPVQAAAEPVVIVRKGRIPPAATQPPPADDAPAKPPRVFRIQTAAQTEPASTDPAEAAPVVPLASIPRRRRRAAPVTILRGAPETNRPAATPLQLAQRLKAVDAVIDAIRGAQAFQLKADACAADWHELSARARALQGELQALLRPAR